MRRRPVLPHLAALLLGAAPVTAQEQPVPMCLAQREGMTFCFADKLCLCRHEPGGSLTGRPPGFRWDCGALRPACGVVPPDTAPGGGVAPPVMVQPFVQPPWPRPDPGR